MVIIPYILAFFTMFNIDIPSLNESRVEPIVEVVEESSKVQSADTLQPMVLAPVLEEKGELPTSTADIIRKTSSMQNLDVDSVLRSGIEVERERAEKEVAESAKVTPTTHKHRNTAGEQVGYITNLALIMLGFLMGAVSWWMIITTLISSFRREFRPRHILILNRIAGSIIILLGTYTLLSVLIQ